jgi:hypothetical protein
VVGEQLGQVTTAGGERLDPLGGRPVLVDPGRAGDLRVGDVADEHVPEGVLALVSYCRARLRADELPELKLAEPPLNLLGA